MVESPSSDAEQPAKLFARIASTSGATNSNSAASPTSTSGGCPVMSPTPQPTPQAPSTGGCPVVGTNTGTYDARINMPQSPNAPHPDQTQPLDTRRAPSSIPIAPGGDLPAHQQGQQGTWVYPSQQMFYNAMKRKGWDAHEKDMPQIVAIHNTVNERAWREVCRWESLHCSTCPEPKLLSFSGRPKQYSPKARLLNFLGYKLPFDRHDWIVDRCGTPVRYIIDFYNAAPVDTMIAMHLDVRPALDTPGALWDRVRVQAAWMWSGRWLGEGAGTRDGVRGGESYGRPKGEGRAQSTAATQSTGTA